VSNQAAATALYFVCEYSANRSAPASASEIKTPFINCIGKSGLSSEDLPSLTQYSICISTDKLDSLEKDAANIIKSADNLKRAFRTFRNIKEFLKSWK